MADSVDTTTPTGTSQSEAPRPEATRSDSPAVSDQTIARMARRAQHRARGENGRFISMDPSPHVDEGFELPDDRFLDREVSWLQFNERVLQLAEDPLVPLLERARFLAIFSSNLDEFFMVRVAGLKRRIATGLAVRSASGLEPREVLDEISRAAHDLMNVHARVFQQVIRPDLAAQGIQIVRGDEVNDEERAHLKEFYEKQVFPVLTPLAVDPAHPFPYISGLSLNLAVLLVNPKTGREHFARVKVPPALPRFIELPPREDEDGGEDLYSARFIAIEHVIAQHLGTLFPGMEVHEHFTFRVTRNEDLEVEEDDAENLLTALERELTRRRFGPPVRLEVADDMDDHVLDMLVRELDVKKQEVYRLPEPLDLRGLNVIADLDRTELRWPAFVAKAHQDLAPIERSSQADIFAAMRAGDILLHHPYDSFATTVQAFIEQAAADPQVLAIKQTLYRTSGDSPIIQALIEAAEAGKQVLAVVEIKARFDEENNITWARKLERAGVHVVYGLVGLKTHAKLCLVVRRESGQMRRYCHVGTGNYNPKTARLYEDLGLLTADPVVADDLTRLFNQLSGMAPRARFKRLLVAPRTVRSGLLERIEDAIRAAANGTPARVQIKVNSLVDELVIDACYRASQAGVDVDIWVRGICALRPGIQGLSDRIRVRSILGRFLEHSRVFRIAIDGQQDAVFIGSADMMHRNLDRRVEALVRITDPRHIKSLTELLDFGMSDQVQSWHLHGDGHWERHNTDSEGIPLRDLQADFITSYSNRRQRSRRR